MKGKVFRDSMVKVSSTLQAWLLGDVLPNLDAFLDFIDSMHETVLLGCDFDSL